MQLAQRLSEKVYAASSEQRKYLHISAVFACNFANHMYAVCHHLLSEHGLPFESMLPLIEETTRKIHYLTPEEAQTGPARRNDCNIMEDLCTCWKVNRNWPKSTRTSAGTSGLMPKKQKSQTRNINL